MYSCFVRVSNEGLHCPLPMRIQGAEGVQLCSRCLHHFSVSGHTSMPRHLHT